VHSGGHGTVVEEHFQPRVETAWQPSRIDGLDLARAIALMGMVLVNYKAYMQVGTLSPLWLNSLVDFIFGRAATVFVILAGISVTLIFRRTGSPGSGNGFRRYLLRRGILLLAAGSCLWHWWAADVLHFYALYIALGAFLVAWPERRLWLLTIVIALISLPVCAQLTVIYDFGDHLAGLDGRAWGLRLAADYLVSNYYPVFPWFGYFLVGLLLGRREPVNRSFHWRLLLTGLIICTIVETISAGVLTWLDQQDVEVQGHWGLAFLRSEAFPVTPLFVISSGAGGLAVIGLCRLAAAWVGRSPFVFPLYCFGKLSLTLYVGHLLWAFGFVFGIEALGGHVGQIEMFASVGVFCLAGIGFAMVWCRYFKRGPLETLFYRIAHLEWNRPRPMVTLPEA